MPLAFGLSGVGLVGIGRWRPPLPLVVVFAVITGFGNGLMLPSLLTWALGSLTFEQRGRGTGRLDVGASSSASSSARSSCSR